MNFVELSWAEQGGEKYLLSVTFPDGVSRGYSEEIERLIHESGFTSVGQGKWLTPDDLSAPVIMWHLLEEAGFPLEVDMAVLPPPLLLALAITPEWVTERSQEFACGRQSR